MRTAPGTYTQTPFVSPPGIDFHIPIISADGSTIVTTNGDGVLRIFTDLLDRTLFNTLSAAQLELLHDIYLVTTSSQPGFIINLTPEQSALWWSLPPALRELLGKNKTRFIIRTPERQFIYQIKYLIARYKDAITNLKFAGLGRIIGTESYHLRITLLTFFKTIDSIINNPAAYLDDVTMQKQLQDLYKAHNINPDTFGIINITAKNAWLAFSKEFSAVIYQHQQAEMLKAAVEAGKLS